MRSATASSSVVTIPPSPVVAFFVAYSEKQPIPKDPTGRPSWVAPWACAASSTRATPAARLSVEMRLMSAGRP